MTTSVSSFIDEIADKASVDRDAAETAVGTILSVIQQEADQNVVTQLFKQLPGAAELAQKHVVTVGSGGGLLGTVSGALGGEAGLLVAALAQIEGNWFEHPANQKHRGGSTRLHQRKCRPLA